ncbi:uncharacterized protein PRCAT00004422001 [Priceomyces carsonii]|uniref:uncharacterized protein n=1 Tax=Priceomyces carsonii TaxID=28549 RepID=UPI002EDA1FD3|nr:unnamed protein product [Priceomyces carsonii]
MYEENNHKSALKERLTNFKDKCNRNKGGGWSGYLTSAFQIVQDAIQTIWDQKEENLILSISPRNISQLETSNPKHLAKLTTEIRVIDEDMECVRKPKNEGDVVLFGLPSLYISESESSSTDSTFINNSDYVNFGHSTDRDMNFEGGSETESGRSLPSLYSSRLTTTSPSSNWPSVTINDAPELLMKKVRYSKEF